MNVPLRLLRERVLRAPDAAAGGADVQRALLGVALRVDGESRLTARPLRSALVGLSAEPVDVQRRRAERLPACWCFALRLATFAPAAIAACRSPKVTSLPGYARAARSSAAALSGSTVVPSAICASRCSRECGRSRRRSSSRARPLSPSPCSSRARASMRAPRRRPKTPLQALACAGRCHLDPLDRMNRGSYISESLRKVKARRRSHRVARSRVSVSDGEAVPPPGRRPARVPLTGTGRAGRPSPESNLRPPRLPVGPALAREGPHRQAPGLLRRRNNRDRRRLSPVRGLHARGVPPLESHARLSEIKGRALAPLLSCLYPKSQRGARMCSWCNTAIQAAARLAGSPNSGSETTIARRGLVGEPGVHPRHGACRDRTGDLRLAKPTLSQLS